MLFMKNRSAFSIISAGCPEKILMSKLTSPFVIAVLLSASKKIRLSRSAATIQTFD